MSEKKCPAGRGPVLKGPQGPVPFVALWSGERLPSPSVVDSPRGGIGYADETLFDRDKSGVLWTRVLSCRGVGEPCYAKLHSLRQRKAMRSLLCQVCAGPADRNEQGVLWLLHDHRGDWPDWPERMANSQPPLCLRYARIAVRWCPWLTSGFVAVRAHSTVVGVSGALYRPGSRGPQPAGLVQIRYGESTSNWVRAALLLRELHNSTLVEL